MRGAVIISLVAMLASCKRTPPPAPAADAAPPAALVPSSAAPPDEVHWVGQLPPGHVERRVCFASTEPYRPMNEAAADPQSFLFIARVVAQGFTAPPSPTRRRVGTIYLSVIEALRGDSLRPGAMVGLPVDDPPCGTDGGGCGFDWTLAGPGATVVVGCSTPRPHVPYRNAVVAVAGPKAIAVDEIKEAVHRRPDAGAKTPDAGAKPPDAGAKTKPASSGSKP